MVLWRSSLKSDIRAIISLLVVFLALLFFSNLFTSQYCHAMDVGLYFSDFTFEFIIYKAGKMFECCNNYLISIVI